MLYSSIDDLVLVVVMVMASALLKIPDQNNDSCAVSRLVFLPPQCNICATPVVLPILHREDKKNARRQFLGMLFQIQVNHPILPIQSLFQDLNKIFNTNIVIRS